MTGNSLDVRPMGGSFVKPMLELFMLTVLLIVARDPAFDVSVQALPQLASADGPASMLVMSTTTVTKICS